MMMTPILWERLEGMSKTGKATCDVRYPQQKMKQDSYEQLCKLQYAVYAGETGPGGSVQIYEITDAGRTALAAHQAE